MVVSPVVNQRTPAYDASVAGDGDSGHGSLVTARRRPGAKAGPGTGSIHLLCRYVVTGPRRARRVWNKGSLRCMAKERRKFMLCVVWSSCPGPAAGLHLEFPQPPIAWTDRDPRGGRPNAMGQLRSRSGNACANCSYQVNRYLPRPRPLPLSSLLSLDRTTDVEDPG